MTVRRTHRAMLLALLVAMGCATRSDVESLQAQQKEILAKLDKIQNDLAKLPAAPQARPQVDLNKVYDLPIGSSDVRGPRDAKVRITMFSDFQCPYCAKATPVIDEVLKMYPKDVSFVMKQYPLRQIHTNADAAARAAIAAGKQGKFWEMHDELYKSQRDLSPEKLKAIAESLKLDVKRWQTDLDSDETKKAVDADLALGQKSEVRGTPTFFVNGKLAPTRSVEGFKTMIDAILNAK